MHTQSAETPPVQSPLAIVLIYAALGGAWILFSDAILARLVTDPGHLAFINASKGLLFIAVTSVLLYLLLRPRRAALAANQPGPRVRLWRAWLPFVALILFIGALSAGVLLHVYQHERDTHAARLLALVHLKQRELEHWLWERDKDAEFIRTSAFFAELYQHWIQGDATAGAHFQARMRQFISPRTFNAIILLDPDGQMRWTSVEAPLRLNPKVLELAAQASANQQLYRLDPYLEQGRGWIDFVVPIARVRPLSPVAVLHADAELWLGDEAINNPLVGKTAEVLLMRRDGEHLFAIGQLPRLRSQPPQHELAFGNQQTPAAWLWAAAQSPGKAILGLDDRHQEVTGLALPLANTDWFVLAKMDRAEIWEGFSRRAIWVLGGGILLTLLGAAGLSISRQSQALLLEQRLAEERENQRRQLEELVEARTHELYQQSHALRALIDNLPHPIWMKDAEGRLLAVNRAFATLLGHTPEELTGKTALDLWPPEIAARYMDSDARVIHSRCQITLEEYLCDDPKAIFEVFKAPIIDDHGEILGTVGFARDIRPQREMEAELARRAELAESAARAKNAFLANISHEIRTPMNAILGLAHLLRCDGCLTPTQEERLARIETASRHLLTILNDILDLSKIESGRLRLVCDDFAVVPLLDQVCSLVTEAARAKGLHLVIDNQGVPAWLRGDAARIRQILLNYLSNAVKFTERGTIVLRARVLDEDETSVLVCFEVEDTGIGIPPERIPELFEPFNQLDDSLTRRFGGTGLGLAINMQLAALMGGMVGAESQPGVGSIFWFEARFERGHPQWHRETSVLTEGELRLRHAGCRLLLAEDNAINRAVITELLGRAGLKVDQAIDGQQAVALASQGDYDLILMDLQMPVLDGLEATRRLRALPQGADIPILALTANNFDEDRAQCQAAGMNDFIAKPVSAETLFETIARWLPQRPVGVITAPPSPKPTEDPVMTVALERLRSLPGLDCARGLSNLAGQLERYLKLLRRFVEMHRQDPQRMVEALAAGDRKQTRALAHTLKGVAANLGAVAVAEAAAALDALLKSEPNAPTEQVGAAIARIAPALEPLALTLAELEQSPRPARVSDASEQRSASNGRLAALRDELIALLQANDTRALTLARQERAVLTAILGEAQARFDRHLELFEFEEALELLRSIAIQTDPEA